MFESIGDRFDWDVAGICPPCDADDAIFTFVFQQDHEALMEKKAVCLKLLTPLFLSATATVEMRRPYRFPSGLHLFGASAGTLPTTWDHLLRALAVVLVW